MVVLVVVLKVIRFFVTLITEVFPGARKMERKENF